MSKKNTQHTIKKIKQFQSFIWHFYKKNKRPFPWRETHDPYNIVVSEVMLQQTQTDRVIPKYEQFITELPTFKDLANTPLRTVLSLWQGLGYNRRGRYLHLIAQKIILEHNGILPNNPETLVTFPGLGKATAASICAFAYNTPTIFIETNIRTVFLHSFFKDQTNVSDKKLLPLIAQTVDQENPREWYYALMDYGVHLKKMLPNPNRKSKHHVIQSKFEGSDRQIRGQIIKILTQHLQVEKSALLTQLSAPETRITPILDKLIKENLISLQDNFLHISKF